MGDIRFRKTFLRKLISMEVKTLFALIMQKKVCVCGKEIEAVFEQTPESRSAWSLSNAFPPDLDCLSS